VKQRGTCVWEEEGSRGTGECSTINARMPRAEPRASVTVPTSPFCSCFKPNGALLDAACAKDLVKGDWPELQLLDIRWG
jgi:hypothetical protein